MPERRKIAAILAADVVGFSRMASIDEDRTLVRLRALRANVFDPIIASQNGRVVLANPGYIELIGRRVILGKTIGEGLPDAVAQEYLAPTERRLW